jgi:hypothetical protein
MAGHSRSKNGVASLAFVPAIHAFRLTLKKDVDARDKRGHDVEMLRSMSMYRLWRLTPP